MADNVELVMRFHPVGGEDVSLLSMDFVDEAQALEAIARALASGAVWFWRRPGTTVKLARAAWSSTWPTSCRYAFPTRTATRQASTCRSNRCGLPLFRRRRSCR